MEWTGLNQLRRMFLDFYVSKGHYLLESASLIPQDDKSLLLINSGMAPLKKYFLGQAKVPGNRATSCQKCIRTPDIERVGKTSRHGTYFEMLGNFSFADYFKREAITWAWEFLTQVLAIPAQKLYCSVYEEDDEAYDIWTKEIGVSPEHMKRLGREDNFWEIGSGPCGPCSEIYFDRGPENGCGKPTYGVGCDCDRYVEIWNLVFTQFISDGNGHYTKMEHGNIDTGMGLERLACMMQGVGNLFEVDTVQNIMKHIERIAGVRYKQDEKTDVSLRVITDHIRSTVFMIGDGVFPTNEGRGYVLRRLLRRAARHGRLLGIDRPFLYEVVDTVVQENECAYPELRTHADYIKRVIRNEEEGFARTIGNGLQLLNDSIEQLERSGGTTLSGDTAFRLGDTFGFPIDLTREILAEKGLDYDADRYNQLLTEQKTKGREDAKKKDFSWEGDLFKGIGVAPTRFAGYGATECAAVVKAIATAEGVVEAAGEGTDVKLVLDQTTFYAESGGQIADTGVITAGHTRVRITDCQKSHEGYYVHTGRVLTGVIETGAQVTAVVDAERRASIMRNHTAAHLLQSALRRVLGDHVHQAGSYVSESRVRFDFSHFEAVKPEELHEVERLVNENILAALNVVTEELPIEKARERGAMALFGEKYGDIVRVVTVPEVSVEFCGGTHVSNTASLGLFKILSESSVAAGVRRIEGTTGRGVLEYIDERNALLSGTVCALKAANAADLPARAAAVTAHIRELEHEIARLGDKLAAGAVQSIESSRRDVGSCHLYTASLAGAKSELLRSICDELKQKDDSAVIVLAAVDGGKGTFAAAAAPGAIKAGAHAGNLVREVARVTGGNGGGKPDFAMAGAKDVSLIDKALARAAELLA